MRRALITGLAALTLTGASLEGLTATPASASASMHAFAVHKPRPRQGFELLVRPMEAKPKPGRKTKSKKSRRGKKARKTENTRGIRKSGNATVLRVPRGLERKLGDLYFRHVRDEPDVHRGDVVGPINIHYGKIVRKQKPHVVFYAIGDTGVFGDLINPKTLPHVWRKVGTKGKWQYVGPTPKGLCGPNLVPRKLAAAWRVGCK